MNGEGYFKASDKHGIFLNTEQVFYDVLTDDYSFLGRGDDNKSWITFTVEKKQDGGPPYTQENYDAPVKWSVRARGEDLKFKSAVVNFRYETSDPQKILGSITFTLEDGSPVSGEFEIKKIAD